MTDPRIGRAIVRGNRSTTVKTAVDYELDNAFELYYNVKKSEGMRDRTLSDYKTHWRYFREWLDPLHPAITLREVTVTVLRAYMYYMTDGRNRYDGVTAHKMAAAKMSPMTVSIRLKSLRTMFNFWASECMIEVNPITNIKPPKMDDEGKETFTDDQVRALIGVADSKTFAGFRDRVLMMLLADGGYRINEALNLMKEHLDMKMRCFILPAWMNKNRKPRIVPVSAEVIRELIELIGENNTYFDSEYIFLSNYGGQLTADHFRHRLINYGIKAGFDEEVGVNPHNFRHYFCTTYLLNGGDIFTLQRIVAHADIKTTRKYVNMTDDNVRTQHGNFSPMARLGIKRVNNRRK